MKLLAISSILILSRTTGVAFGSSIRGSEFGGNDEEQQSQHKRMLEVTNLFADNSKNGDGSNINGRVQPKSDVALTMTSSKTEYAANESVAIDITVKNNDATKPARILSWINPCNGAGDASSKSSPVDMSFFDVKTANGQPALYLGALIKRKEPTDKDYTTLKAGEQISCAVNLDKYFQFTSPSGDDEYKISYSITSMQLSNPFNIQGTNAIESLEATALSLKISARTSLSRSLRVRDQYMRGLQTGSTTFNSCSATRQSLIVEVRKQALTASTDALSNITSISLWHNTTSCSRHNTWFGPFDTNRFQGELKPGYEKISAALNNATILFDCGCNQKYYAYVYPSNPFRIYLCKYFWSAPMTGTDSKMGTIIHEMSHFTVTANTDDYAYGQSACKSLATTNPLKAVNNADSHEYFAENTPNLSCNPY